jgi:serine/threonine protein kinase
MQHEVPVMPSRKLPEARQHLMFDRFQVLEDLGAGLQGRVVRAFDVSTRGEVAVKILQLHSAVGLARFKMEFRTLVGLVHPNLVRLGDLFERDQVWAFSMELVRGGDFLSWVRSDLAGFSEQRLRSGLAQLASALHALHRARLVHRDLKPENERVTPEGRVVLVDFGLVAEHGPSARTASQHLVGTVGYIAPEVLNGLLATDKSDLYALGAMLYQALTGALPYDGTLFQVAMLQRAGLPA